MYLYIASVTQAHNTCLHMFGYTASVTHAHDTCGNELFGENETNVATTKTYRLAGNCKNVHASM